MRTRETLDLLFRSTKLDAAISYERELYLGSPEIMLKHIKNADNNADHILMIAHNPGTQLLALDLINRANASTDLIEQMQYKFPTCGMAHFEFPVQRWNELAAGKGNLRFFARPKSLET